jgi:hypothetical protein
MIGPIQCEIDIVFYVHLALVIITKTRKNATLCLLEGATASKHFFSSAAQDPNPKLPYLDNFDS